MQINNDSSPLKNSNVDVFLKFALATQIALWGLMGLELMNLQVPILIPFVGSIYLIFVPGLLISKLLKLYSLSIIETILYSVGISMAFLMFIGLFVNTLYPYFGISKPVSFFPLMITLTVFLIILFTLDIKNKRFLSPITYTSIELKNLFRPALALILLPFLAIFGTYLINFYQNNILLMLLIVVIALVPVLVTFGNLIPRNLYPLAIFTTALSLLYHRSLISMYLCGWDIHHEYYLSDLVLKSGYWDSTIPYNVNGMLSIVMLAPIYSIISNMNLIWLFKIIYPLLFALVPLGLYQILQKQINDKIAFLACFFFISLFTFYTEMLQLARQQIAELFLVLLILTMINKNINREKKAFLLILFGASLIVSHYGLSYIYMFALIVVWLTLLPAKSLPLQRMKSRVYYMKTRKIIISRKSSDTKEKKVITSTFVLIFIVFTLAWHMYISRSSTFSTIVTIGDRIVKHIYTELFNPEATHGLYLMMGETLSPLHRVSKYLHLTTQFFISVGILTLLMSKQKNVRFEREYAAFSYVNFIICLSGIAVPYFASSLNTSRLYQITLIFLAPFCIIGGIITLELISKVVRIFSINLNGRNFLKVLSLFFAVFLLFNSGWIYQVINDNPCSISLGATVDYPCFNEQEVLGARWLYKVKNNDPIYADGFRRLLLSSFEWGRVRSFPFRNDRLFEDSYIYFGKFNLKHEKILIIYRQKAIKKHFYVDYNSIIKNRNKIYTNASVYIYR